MPTQPTDLVFGSSNPTGLMWGCVAAVVALVGLSFVLLYQPLWATVFAWDLYEEGVQESEDVHLQWPNRLPSSGEATVLGIAPAGTRVTLFGDLEELGDDEELQSLELHRMVVQGSGNEQRPFLLPISAEMVDDGGDEEKSFWLRLERDTPLDAPSKATTKTKWVHAKVTVMGDDPGLLWDDGFFQFRSNLVEQLTPMRRDNLLSALRVGDASGCDVAIPYPWSVVVWIVDAHTEGDEHFVTAAALLLQRRTSPFFGLQVGSVELGIDAHHRALRAGSGDQWSEELRLETNPNGLVTFDYRMPSGKGEIVEDRLQITVGDGAAHPQIAGLSMVEALARPSVVSAESPVLSLKMPGVFPTAHDYPSGFRHLQYLRTQRYGLAAEPVFSMVPSGFSDTPAAVVVSKEGETLYRAVLDEGGSAVSVPLDAAWERPGWGQVQLLTAQGAWTQTLRFTTAQDWIIDPSLFKEGSASEQAATKAALEALWVDLAAPPDLRSGRVGDRSNSSWTLNRMTLGTGTFWAHNPEEIVGKLHLKTRPARVGQVLLVLLFIGLVALSITRTPWRSSWEQRERWPLALVVVASVGISLALAGLYATEEVPVWTKGLRNLDGWLTLPELLAAAGLFIAAVISLFSMASRRFSNQSIWMGTSLALAAVLGLATYAAGLYSLQALTAVIAAALATTIVLIAQLIVGFGEEDTVHHLPIGVRLPMPFMIAVVCYLAL